MKKRDFAEGAGGDERGPAEDLWDGILGEAAAQAKDNPKRKRQNSFANTFSDPMFR